MNLLPTDSTDNHERDSPPHKQTTKARKRKRDLKEPIQTQTPFNKDETTGKALQWKSVAKKNKDQYWCQVRREEGGDGEGSGVIPNTGQFWLS